MADDPRSPEDKAQEKTYTQQSTKLALWVFILLIVIVGAGVLLWIGLRAAGVQ